MEMRARPTRPPRRPAPPSGGNQRTPSTTPGGRGGGVPGQSSTDLVDGAGTPRSPRRKRAAVKRMSRLWPNGVVPYTIDKNLRELIEFTEELLVITLHYITHQVLSISSSETQLLVSVVKVSNDDWYHIITLHCHTADVLSSSPMCVDVTLSVNQLNQTNEQTDKHNLSNTVLIGCMLEEGNLRIVNKKECWPTGCMIIHSERLT